MKTPPSLTAKPVPCEDWAVFEPKKLLICITVGRTWASTSRALCEAAGVTGLYGAVRVCACADNEQQSTSPAISADRSIALFIECMCFSQSRALGTIQTNPHTKR